MNSHKWVDEEFPNKLGGVPTFVGSHEYVDEPIPGPAQSYRDAENSPDGRVFPFNNGGGWKWCAVIPGDNSSPLQTSFTSVEDAKRCVEIVVWTQLKLKYDARTKQASDYRAERDTLKGLLHEYMEYNASGCIEGMSEDDLYARAVAAVGYPPEKVTIQ